MTKSKLRRNDGARLRAEHAAEVEFWWCVAVECRTGPGREQARAMAQLPCTLFQAQLRRAWACTPARIWVGARTARQAWEQCTNVGWMWWFVRTFTCGTPHLPYNEGPTPGWLRQRLPFDLLRLCAPADWM